MFFITASSVGRVIHNFLNRAEVGDNVVEKVSELSVSMMSCLVSTEKMVGESTHVNRLMQHFLLYFED